MNNQVEIDSYSESVLVFNIIFYIIGVALYVFGVLLYVSSALKAHSLINPIIAIIVIIEGIFIVWLWNKILMG